jgi:TRAP-type C4-dicarboxylate transport system permease small subunit
MFNRFEKFLFKIEKAIATLLLAIMFIAVSLQVVARYFYLPIIDTTEMSVMIMSLITFIGAGLGVYTKEHISVEIEKMFQSTRIRFLFKFFTYISMMTFAFTFLFLGYSLFTYALESGERTLELGIPSSIPYATMIVGLVCMLIHTVSNLINLFWKGPQTIEKADEES